MLVVANIMLYAERSNSLTVVCKLLLLLLLLLYNCCMYIGHYNKVNKAERMLRGSSLVAELRMHTVQNRHQAPLQLSWQ
jgi:hypothetical protein